jgi:hypothetical protein
MRYAVARVISEIASDLNAITALIVTAQEISRRTWARIIPPCLVHDIDNVSRKI